MDAVVLDHAKLLQQFLDHRDRELRDELVLAYSFIIKNVAKSTRGLYANYATFDDIVNQGVITLIDCLERYDPSKNMEFEPYAYVRIRNATIDFIRKSDFLPRRVRQTAKRVNQAFSSLGHSLMREPSDVELAEYLEISVDQLSKHYGEVANSQLLSVEEIVIFITNDDDMDIPSPYQDPKQIFELQELHAFLKQSIEELNEREQVIVSLYYYENLKFKEIAEVLGVSEARISQMHSKILEKLQDTMKEIKEE